MLLDKQRKACLCLLGRLSFFASAYATNPVAEWIKPYRGLNQGIVDQGIESQFEVNDFFCDQYSFIVTTITNNIAKNDNSWCEGKITILPFSFRVMIVFFTLIRIEGFQVLENPKIVKLYENLAPNGICLGAKSIQKFWLQSKFILI